MTKGGKRYKQQMLKKMTELKCLRISFVDQYRALAACKTSHNAVSNVGNILVSQADHWASPTYLTWAFAAQSGILSSDSYPQERNCRNVGSVLTHLALAVKVDWRATSKLATQPFLAIIKVSVLTIFFCSCRQEHYW